MCPIDGPKPRPINASNKQQQMNIHEDRLSRLRLMTAGVHCVPNVCSIQDRLWFAMARNNHCVDTATDWPIHTVFQEWDELKRIDNES